MYFHYLKHAGMSLGSVRSLSLWLWPWPWTWLWLMPLYILNSENVYHFLFSYHYYAYSHTRPKSWKLHTFTIFITCSVRVWVMRSIPIHHFRMTLCGRSSSSSVMLCFLTNMCNGWSETMADYVKFHMKWAHFRWNFRWKLHFQAFVGFSAILLNMAEFCGIWRNFVEYFSQYSPAYDQELGFNTEGFPTFHSNCTFPKCFQWAHFYSELQGSSVWWCQLRYSNDCLVQILLHMIIHAYMISSTILNLTVIQWDFPLKGNMWV